MEEHNIRVDLLEAGREFVFNSHKYIKLASVPTNPLVELSVRQGLYAAVHVGSGEIHAFDKQLVEIKEVYNKSFGNSQIIKPVNDQNEEETKDD